MESNKKIENPPIYHAKKGEFKKDERFPTKEEIHLLGGMGEGPSQAGKAPISKVESAEINPASSHEDTGALSDLDGTPEAFNAGPLARGGLKALKKISKG
jgi:hypothetical protein